MAAAIELERSRLLVKALDAEIVAIRTRLETEQRFSAILSDLAASRKAESEALFTTIAAKNEALFAKDALAERQERLIVELQKKRSSTLKRISDMLIGAGAVLIFK